MTTTTRTLLVAFTLTMSTHLAHARSSAANDFHVDANATTGLNDGSSWANAFQGASGLQVALGLVSAGDRIFVAHGSYLPTLTNDREVAFRLIDGVEVYGGFVGTEASPDERPPFGAAPSVLTGDLNGDDGSGIKSDNSYHLLLAPFTSESTVLDGFTITGGFADGSGNANKGAGIVVTQGASPTIRRCRFLDNQAVLGGGAAYITAGGHPTMTDVIFEGNSGYFGGAIYTRSAGFMTFERCTFRSNSSGRGGAMEFSEGTQSALLSCLFDSNSATSVDGGGALYVGSFSQLQIINGTVVGNVATGSPYGGLRNDGATSAVANSVFWGNEGSGAGQVTRQQIDGTMNVTYSLVQGGFVGIGNIAADPDFLNAAGDDFRLGFGSPAIDAGENAKVPTGHVLDLLYAPRFRDDPAVADTGAGNAPIVDLGAFESQVPVFNRYCFGDGSGTPCPCSNAGSVGNGCANTRFPGGCSLSVQGYNSVANDSLVLVVTQSSPGAPGIFILGDDQSSGGNGVVFGDGLRCVGTNLCMIEVTHADSSGSATSSAAISQDCGVAPGDRKRLQWWYRDRAQQPCVAGFNSSNGVEVVWLP